MSIAAVVTRYAALAEPADWRCSRRPGRCPVPKVNRACNSVHSRVEATVIRAFASAQGITVASSGTTAPASSPTPPPHTTNRAKEARVPSREVRGRDALGFDGCCDSMAASFRADLNL
ncbi:MAG: hypothetical protein HOV84_07690 [Streptomyces sp.]|nr:hypothetical protein [Streptomyces sp.]